MAGRKQRAVRGEALDSSEAAARRDVGSLPASRHQAAMLWAAGAGLMLLALYVFVPVRSYGFVTWDDPFYVLENPQVSAGLTWHGFLWALTAGGDFYWHPLTWLSHMLDVQVFGLQAGGHHVTSLVIHLASSLLLLGTLFRMTGSAGRSAFVAAVFAVHPLHVESVAWVAERKDVLSGFFWILTLAAYTAYARRPGRRRFAVVVGCFLLGLMSKPMVVTLPLILLLLDVWPLDRLPATAPAGDGDEARRGRAAATAARWWPLVREKLVLFALAGAGSVAAFVYQAHADAVRSLDAYPLSLRAANALVSYATYLRQAVWPTGLAAFYPYPRHLSGWVVLISLATLLGLTVVVWRLRRYRYLPVGWLWFLVTLLPVIGLIQVGEQAMADRFMYLPLIGLLVVVAWGVPDLLRRQVSWPPVLLPAVASCLVLTAAVSARGQVEYWRDSESMWRRAAVATRDNHRAHANLGIQYAEEGRVDEALAELTEAVRIAPDAGDLYNRIGMLRLKQGRANEARDAFAAAVRVWPQYGDAHNNLGRALEAEGRVEEAIGEYREAIRLEPARPVPHDNLATALASAGRLEEAIQEAREAVRLDGAFVQARNNLGVILGAAGRPDEAMEQYREALRIRPDYASAHANLADACGRQGRFEEAAAEYLLALRSDSRRPDWQFKLALTLDRLGRRDEAATHLRAALDIDPSFEPAQRALEQLAR